MFSGNILIPDSIIVTLYIVQLLHVPLLDCCLPLGSQLCYLLHFLILIHTFPHFLMFCLYCPWYLLVSARVLVLFSLSFTLCLSSILYNVVRVIHTFCFVLFLPILNSKVFSFTKAFLIFSVPLQLCHRPLFASCSSQNLNPVYTLVPLLWAIYIVFFLWNKYHVVCYFHIVFKLCKNVKENTSS